MYELTSCDLALSSFHQTCRNASRPLQMLWKFTFVRTAADWSERTFSELPKERYCHFEICWTLLVYLGLYFRRPLVSDAYSQIILT